MSLVTVEQFKAYAKKPDSDSTGEELYQTYIDAAEAMVKDFLSFDFVTQTYTAVYFGDGKPYLQLRAKPVTEITSISVNGATWSSTDFIADGETIVNKNGVPFPVGAVVAVVFKAGFAAVPATILLTILRITALLSMEGGENIGVSSTSFDGGSTRSFVNYTSFDKYLAVLEPYRVRWLGRRAP